MRRKEQPTHTDRGETQSGKKGSDQGDPASWEMRVLTGSWGAMFQRLRAALKEHLHLRSSAGGNEDKYTLRLQNNNAKNTVGGLGFFSLKIFK